VYVVLGGAAEEVIGHDAVHDLDPPADTLAEGEARTHSYVEREGGPAPARDVIGDGAGTHGHERPDLPTRELVGEPQAVVISASKVWRESKGRGCAESLSAERRDAPKTRVTS
jgi:hypothetical protein